MIYERSFSALWDELRTNLWFVPTMMGSYAPSNGKNNGPSFSALRYMLHFGKTNV